MTTRYFFEPVQVKDLRCMMKCGLGLTKKHDGRTEVEPENHFTHKYLKTTRNISGRIPGREPKAAAGWMYMGGAGGDQLVGGPDCSQGERQGGGGGIGGLLEIKKGKHISNENIMPLAWHIGITWQNTLARTHWRWEYGVHLSIRTRTWFIFLPLQLQTKKL